MTTRSTAAACLNQAAAGHPEPTDQELTMTTDPQTDRDFDGCRRACRQAGAHTLVYGECEQAAEPEPTVSVSHVYVAADGQPALGFDTYTVAALADLIEPGLRNVVVRLGPNALGMLERGETVRLSGGECADLARQAAHAIVHRHAAVPVSAAAPEARLDLNIPRLHFDTPTDRAALRDRIAEALLDHLSRTADIRPGRSGDLAFMPEVADEERMRMAAALAAVLPPPADRAAVLEEAAQIAVAENQTCPAVYQCQPCLTRERVAAALLRAAVDARRLAAETAGPEAQSEAGPTVEELAGHLAAQRMSVLQGAFRILGWPPLRFELVDDEPAADEPAVPSQPEETTPECVCTEDACPPYCPCHHAAPAAVQTEEA